MERRDFLARIGTALALAMTPGVTGATTLRGPDLSALDDGDRQRMADELRERMAAIRHTAEMPNLRQWVAERGFDPELPGKILGAMWMTSTFRDMPQKLRRSPEIQAWAMAELPMVAEAAYESADLLEGLDATDRVELVELLEAEPELLDRMLEGLDAHATQRGVERERVEQVQMVATHTSWRLRKQSPEAVIDEYLSRFDRICRRHRVDRRSWREGLATEVPAWLAMDVLCDADSCEVEHAAEQLAEIDAVDAVSTAGSHLGIAMQHRPGRKGVQVEHVLKGTPAARAGLVAGDRIVGIDGQAFEATELVGWLATQEPERVVQIEIDRHGERLVTEAPLGTGPADRIAIRRPRAALRGRAFGYLTAAASVLTVGLYILGTGAGMFVIGLILIGAAGGYDVGIGTLGTVLTVGGLLVMALGLLVVLIGAIIKLIKRSQTLAPAR